MNDEAQPSLEPEVAASEPTLDDVISEFNIGQPEVTQQTVEQPTEPQFTAQTTIDPYDANSIQQFVDTKVGSQQQELEQLKSQLSAMQQKEANAQTEADIKQAVGVLTKAVDGFNPDLAEAFLEMKARKDVNFNNIWTNRHTNPQAFEKAMGIIANEAKTTFSVKTDGQLVENQRAMNQSIQTNTNQAPVAGNEWEQRLSEASTLEERDAIRRQMMQG